MRSKKRYSVTETSNGDAESKEIIIYIREMIYRLLRSVLSTTWDTATVFLIPSSPYKDSAASGVSGVPAKVMRWLWSPKVGASQRVADLEVFPDFRSPI